MPPVGFELTISVGERPQTYALDRAATGIGETRQVIYRILPKFTEMSHGNRLIITADKNFEK